MPSCLVLSETLNFHHQFRIEIRPGAVDFCTAVLQGTSNGIVQDTRVTANDHFPTLTGRIELVGVTGKQHWIFSWTEIDRVASRHQLREEQVL
jgi:hypothetical protein